MSNSTYISIKQACLELETTEERLFELCQTGLLEAYDDDSGREVFLQAYAYDTCPAVILEKLQFDVDDIERFKTASGVKITSFQTPCTVAPLAPPVGLPSEEIIEKVREEVACLVESLSRYPKSNQSVAGHPHATGTSKATVKEYASRMPEIVATILAIKANWDTLSEESPQKVHGYSEDEIKALAACGTSREIIRAIKKTLPEHGIKILTTSGARKT